MKHSVDEARFAVARRLIGDTALERVAWQPIATRVGVSAERLRRRFDPEYRERVNLKIRAYRREVGINGRPVRVQTEAGKPKPDDVASRLAEIPDDNRSLTARTFGDPLPGRRAIDMEGQG